MEGKESSGGTFEWIIENLSCWCRKVHGKCIDSPPFYSKHFTKLELYPRGLKIRAEGMVVRVLDTEKEFSGDMSFIGSEGTLICAQRVRRGPEEDQQTLELPPGPKYEWVVNQIRKNEDRLTLRFCIHQSQESHQQRMCTRIDVLKTSLKIDECFIGELVLLGSKRVAFVPFCPQHEKESEGLLLKAVIEDRALELQLEPVNAKKNAVSVKSCVSLLRSDCLPELYEGKEHVFFDDKSWTFSDSLKTDQLLEKGVTLLLSFKIVNGVVKKSYRHLLYEGRGVCVVPYSDDGDPVESANHPDESVSALVEDFMSLYQNQNYSDLQIKCGSVSFPAHRSVLSARSPVLKRLISKNAREEASGCLDIEGLEAPTLGRFLVFLYTGTMDDMQDEGALKLYYAAHKYQVPTLKRRCAAFIRTIVSISNVCDILCVANKHQDDELTLAAHDFILENYNDVLRSEEWKVLMKTEPLLAVEMVTHFAAQNCVGKKDHQ